MSEELDEYPHAFRDEPTMPWETTESVRWPYGQDKGTALSEMTSRDLLRKRDWLERFGVAPWLMQAIDQILLERQGE